MRNWAILIGVNKYRYQERLRNAVADAKAIFRVLTEDYGFDQSRIVQLYNGHARRSRILRLINYVVPLRWRVQRQDQLFVFFAGHGGRVRRGSRNIWFLVPSDGKPVSDNPDNWNTVLASSEIRSLESQFKGAHIFYVFDCCHAGMAFTSQVPAKRPTKSLLSAHALVAGRGRETVNDDGGTGHSVFTESLVEGLSGWGGLGSGPDNQFIASDLISFVRRDVPDQIRRRKLHPIQKPFGGPLGGNTDGREFTLTPVSPRLPTDLVPLLLHKRVDIREGGIRQLGALFDPKLTDVKLLALSRMAHDPSPSVRREVAFHLNPNLDTQALSLLFAMLHDSDEHVLLAAIHSLSGVRRNKSQTIPHVKRLLSHHGYRVKRAAQSCLALLGVRKALSAVIEQLPTEQGSIRREMIAVLKKLPPTAISREALTQVLAEHLRDKDWRSRRAAAEALGELGLSGAVTSLIRLAGSATQHFMVRYASVEALGHIGQAASRDVVLRALLNDRSLLVRTAAGEAVGSLNGPNAIDVLVRAILVDPEWRVRRSAVESCGLLQNRAATQSLIQAAADPHFRVRMSVAQALGEIADGLGRTVLERLASIDQSLFVKRAAERALQRL